MLARNVFFDMVWSFLSKISIFPFIRLEPPKIDDRSDFEDILTIPIKTFMSRIWSNLNGSDFIIFEIFVDQFVKLFWSCTIAIFPTYVGICSIAPFAIWIITWIRTSIVICLFWSMSWFMWWCKTPVLTTSTRNGYRAVRLSIWLRWHTVTVVLYRVFIINSSNDLYN